MSARKVNAGGAAVEITARDRTKAGLDKVAARFRAAGRGMAIAGGAMQVASGALIAPMIAASKIFNETGDALDKMSGRTGVSVEALSTLGFAAGTSGAAIEDVEAGIRGMNRQILSLKDGSKGAEEIFSQLGLTWADLKDLSPEERFKLVADRLVRIEDMGLRSALAMKVLGKSGTSLLPMISQGAAGIEALQAHAEKLNLGISTEDATLAANLNDRLGELWAQVKALAFHVGAALAPSLIAMIQAVQPVLAGIIQWVKDNRELIATVAKIVVLVGVVGSGLVGLGATFAVISIAVGGLMTAFGFLVVVAKVAFIALAAISSFFLTVVAPIGAVIAALLYLSGTTGKVVGFIQKQFTALKDFLGTTFGGIRDALAAGDLQLAARVGMAAIRVAWAAGMLGLQTMWVNTRVFILNVLDTLATGAINIFDRLLGVLGLEWQDFTQFFAFAWAQSVGSVVNIANSVLPQLLKVASKVIGSVVKGVTIVAKAIDKILPKLRTAAAAAGESALADALAGEMPGVVFDPNGQGINQIGEEKLTEAQQRRRGRVDDLEKRKADRRAGGDAEIEAARRRLTDAQGELDAARAEAARKLEEKRSAPASPEFDGEGISERLTGVGKGSSQGTFSGAAAARLGQGLGPMDRMAKGIEEVVKEQIKTRKAVEKAAPKAL